jgi:hypothetical protein
MQGPQLVKHFILFHNKRHPRTMGGKKMEAFLSRLATHAMR